MRTTKKIASSITRQAGMTLTESLLVLAVGAAVAVVAYSGYRVANSDVMASTVSQDTVGMIGKIKQIWGGNYTTVTPTGLNNAGVITGSFKWDATASAVLDAMGNTVTFDGAQSKFAFLLGPFSKEDCAKIAPGLSSIAYSINIGDAAALTGGNVGTVTGGAAYKTATTITPANLLTGCGGTNVATKIAVEVR